MPDLLIRSATPNDTDAIIAMLREFHAEHLAFDAARWTTAKPPQEQYAAWIAALIANAGDGVVFVAQANAQVVGYAIAEVEEESTQHWSPRAVYVHDLFVIKAHRRLGLARRLVNAVFEWSAAKHPTLQLRLMTAAPNEAARAFFASLGFEPCVVEMIRKPSVSSEISNPESQI